MQQGSGAQGELFPEARDVAPVGVGAQHAAPAAQAARAPRALTDEEILGIGASEPEPGTVRHPDTETNREDHGDAAAVGAQHAAPLRDDRPAGVEAAAPEWLAPLFADARWGEQARAHWSAHQQLETRAATLDAVDHAYYSGDPSAQAKLARRLFAEDPAALRSMVEAASRALAGETELGRRDTEATESGEAERDSSLRAARPDTSLRADSAQNDSARVAQAQLARERGEWRAEQLAAFARAADQAARAEVRGAIERTLGAVLPEEIAPGARRRIANDISGEIERALEGDAALAEQVAAVVEGWRLDAAAQQQAAQLIAARAAALVPGATRRVVNEWTSTVLAARRERTVRQQAAADRVDIVGGGAAPDSMAKKLTPRDIDYRRTTDEAILSL